MHKERMQSRDKTNDVNEPLTAYNRLNINEARAIEPDGKPKLYKEVQKMLAGVKTSLADDIIESRQMPM